MMECADKEFKANSVFFRQHFFYRIASCFYWTMNDVIKFFLGFPQGIFSRVYLNYSISFYFGFFFFSSAAICRFYPSHPWHSSTEVFLNLLGFKSRLKANFYITVPVTIFCCSSNVLLIMFFPLQNRPGWCKFYMNCIFNYFIDWIQ